MNILRLNIKITKIFNKKLLIILIVLTLIMPFMIIFNPIKESKLNITLSADKSKTVGEMTSHYIELNEDGINLLFFEKNELTFYHSYDLELSNEDYSIISIKNDPLDRIIIASKVRFWIYSPYNCETYSYTIENPMEEFEYSHFEYVMDGFNLFLIIGVDSIDSNKDRIVLVSEECEELSVLHRSTTTLQENKLSVPPPFVLEKNTNDVYILTDNNSYNGSHSNLIIESYDISEKRFTKIKNHYLGIHKGVYVTITMIPPSKICIAGEGFGYYIQYDKDFEIIEHEYIPLIFLKGTGEEGLYNGSSYIKYDDENNMLLWMLESRKEPQFGLMQFQAIWCIYEPPLWPFYHAGRIGGIGTNLRNVEFLGTYNASGILRHLIRGYDYFNGSSFIQTSWDFNRYEIEYGSKSIVKYHNGLLNEGYLIFNTGDEYHKYNLITSELTNITFQNQLLEYFQYKNPTDSLIIPIRINKRFNQIEQKILGTSRITDNKMYIDFKAQYCQNYSKIFIISEDGSYKNYYTPLAEEDFIKLQLTEDVINKENFTIAIQMIDGCVWEFNLNLIQLKYEIISKRNIHVFIFSFSIFLFLSTSIIVCALDYKNKKKKCRKGKYVDPEISKKERYEEILGELASMAMVIERDPSSFRDINEESIRTHFLIPLNRIYKGGATAETHNLRGKTDILVREKGENICIIECSFWRGATSFIEKIDQLLNYVTWRDNYTAILVFNRNKTLSKVLKKIPNNVSKHPAYIKQDTTYINETGFRFIFQQENDNDREIILTILVFDIPS